MELLETETRARLMAENEELRALLDKHDEYQQRLEQISTRRPFTQRDWFEESVVKKRKLLVKDRLATLLREHDIPAEAIVGS